jgi:hypothetical protein
MNLRYILLHIDFQSGYTDQFRDKFNLYSKFIGYYLSTHVRKLKLETDGTFNMIAVKPSVSANFVCRLMSEKALVINVLFNNIAAYNLMNEIERYEYCLELLEDGYKIAAQYKPIPLEPLLNLHQQFRIGGYKNEWLHKKKKFKEHGIEVSLNCFFTTYDFQLKITVSDIKTKVELISGMVIRTLPDPVCFHHLFRDVIIENEELIITDFLNRPKFKFLLSDILRKKLAFDVMNIGVEYNPYLG